MSTAAARTAAPEDRRCNTALTTAWDPRVGTPGSGNHPIVCGAPVLATSYAYDANGRVASVTPPGLAADTFAYGTLGRLTSTTRTHDAAHGGGSETTTVAYLDAALTPDATHPEYRPDLRPAAAGTWAQADVPVTATVVYGPGDTVSATDLRDGAVHYLDVNGREVNSADYAGAGAAGWHISTTEYDPGGKVLRSLSAGNREEALNPTSGAGAALGLPADTAAAARMVDEQNFYTPDGMDLTDTYGPYHLVGFADGSVGGARARTRTDYDTGAETGHPAGGPMHLPVTVTTSASRSGIADPADASIVLAEQRSTRNDYALDATNAEGWTFRTPLRVITDPGTGHLAITKVSRFDPVTGLPTESRMPSDTAGTGPGTTKTIYYTAGANPQDPACGNKPQWTNLACKTKHAASARVPGVMPDLPVVTNTGYDYLGRATTVTESVVDAAGATVTRTSTTTYDAGGYGVRVAATAVTGGVGAAVPTVSTAYDPATGLPTTVSAAATAEQAASSMTTGYDDFGRTTSYTDADGNTATTTYDPAGRVATVTDAKGSLTYTYNGAGEHRGLATGLTVSGVTGSFTAGYNPDGQATTETYPNGMTISLSRDETSELVGLTAANAGTTLFTEAVATSIDGQWRHRDATTGTQTYTYDPAARLTTVQDLYADVCTTRGYGFDTDTNRTSLTAYPGDATTPATCQTGTGAVTTSHAYDPADRLTSTGPDTGIGYDAFRRTTALPAADTGASNTDLTVSYYANDLLRSQTQAERALSWTLDPALRLRARTDTANTASTQTNHYDDPSSDNPDWIAESSDGSAWTRNITDLLGGLALTIDQAGLVTWQLANLHGDITATLDPTGTPTYRDTDEYGNPHTATTPARYGWLGGKQRPGDDLAGLLLMGVRLYQPTLGRFLQTDPEPGGSCNNYDYTCANPTNAYDLDGKRCWSWRWACSGARRTWHVVRFVRNAPYTAVGYGWARRHGGRCHWQPGLMVGCGGMRGGYARGGTTLGNTWMYGGLGGRAKLRHESRHATQWAIFGFSFPILYGAESLRTRRHPNRNIFERWAGLRDGGYAMGATRGQRWAF